MPGVGKTALALNTSQDPQVRSCFPDGVLWATLGPSPSHFHLFRRWGALLGLPFQEALCLTTTEEWATKIRTMLAQRRMLMIIDDAWHMQDAVACLVGGPGCSYLLTTRFPRIALAFAGSWALAVRELDDEESLRLLTSYVPAVVSREGALMQDLVGLTGGLPLTLTLLGTYLRSQAHDAQSRRVRTALGCLQDPRLRLRITAPRPSHAHAPSVSGCMISLHESIQASVHRLSDNARQVLLALAQFPSKPASFSELEALTAAGCSPYELDELTDAGLLESAGEGYYALHRAITDFARDRVHGDATPSCAWCPPLPSLIGKGGHQLVSAALKSSGTPAFPPHSSVL